MRFAQTEMFPWLWAVAVLGIFLLWGSRRKIKIIEKFAETQLVSEIAANFSSRKEKVKRFLILFICILSIIALARPQWGFEWREVKRQGLDILVAMDTSKSMLTEDVKPNRLERTKLAVQDLIKKLKGDRIGLIAFAGDAFLVCPLTVDYGGFLLSLNEVDTNTIPRGGTAIARAIDEAMKAYTSTPGQYKALIIVTDGENLEGDPLKVAQEAKAKGMKIYCVGIGTEEGELIRVKNEQNEYEFLKDAQGNFVKSRLNEDLLQKIALETGGVYVRASGAEFGLDLIYDQELSKLEKREIESKMEKKYHEHFQIPLGLAILLLIVETCLSTRKNKYV